MALRFLASFIGCLFDSSGAMAHTVVHAAARKATLDDFFRRRGGSGFPPSNYWGAYERYVDGGRSQYSATTGMAGQFGHVVGVGRVVLATALSSAGAGVVVRDICSDVAMGGR